MILTCTNKGCYASGEHTLDKNDNNVYCIDCGEAIDVPQTTKVILKSLGQVQRKVKSGVQFTCKECKHTDKPLLKSLAADKKVGVCRNCDAQLDIHPSFIQAMSVMKEEYMINQ